MNKGDIMKFKVCNDDENNDIFIYLTTRLYNTEILWCNWICNYLGIPKEEYVNILLKHGAFWVQPAQDNNFPTVEQAEAAIKEFEPYLILAKLTN